MVMQRDTRLKLWGWASKGESVKITFNGKSTRTKTGADGKWTAWLGPMKAGGPYTMQISASNKIVLKNILVGDVWLCAGQSNMVHYLELHKERYANEIAQANHSEIRQFLVPGGTDLQKPLDDFSRGNWKTATSGNISKFSVVAYFFAKNLYDQYHVPIGLINASVGGTPIEAWTSEAGLKEFPELTSTIEHNRDTAYIQGPVRAVIRAKHEKEKQPIKDLGLTSPKMWYDTSYVPKNWRAINIPGYWEDQGIKDLDGVMWYRKEIMIPASLAGLAAKIALGRIVDADFVYLNGQLIGNTSYLYPQRNYPVPAGLLKAGKNILVVRVLNNQGKGGFVPDKPYYLSVAGQTIDLKGEWHYRVGEIYNPSKTASPAFSMSNQPTALYNAMIAPVTPYSIKGIIWYQGESNTSKPEAYRRLLPALIADWRNQWKQGDVPFLYVQLPNFMEKNYTPSESHWAIVREAQLKALTMPHTAMAVAIDLGEWNDVHPDNKKPIGDRLALAARHLVYQDKDIVFSGPIYRSSVVEGAKIIIRFSHIGTGLLSSDGEELHEFAIAGKDKKFIWAKAIIRGDVVEVWHEDIAEPLYVRYAWADNPDAANLCNKEGLPASPFRTDY
jgi:sialate O-acetylesterase